MRRYNFIAVDGALKRLESLEGEYVKADEAAKLLEALTSHLEALQRRIAALDDGRKIAVVDGTWDYDPYLHDMANGLIFACAIMANQKPEYLDPPAQWLGDKPALFSKNPLHH